MFLHNQMDWDRSSRQAPRHSPSSVVLRNKHAASEQAKLEWWLEHNPVDLRHTLKTTPDAAGNTEVRHAQTMKFLASAPCARALLPSAEERRSPTQPACSLCAPPGRCCNAQYQSRNARFRYTTVHAPWPNHAGV